MPKLKTHSGAKTRFNLTKSGKVKRAHAYKSHILTKKTTKRGRRLRDVAYADVTNAATIKKMIPYKEGLTLYRRIIKWQELKAQ